MRITPELDNPDLPVDEPTRKDPAPRRTPVEEPPPDPSTSPTASVNRMSPMKMTTIWIR